MRTSALHLCVYSHEKNSKFIPAQTIIPVYVIQALSDILRYFGFSSPLPDVSRLLYEESSHHLLCTVWRKFILKQLPKL
jgi:hypothetical protein